MATENTAAQALATLITEGISEQLPAIVQAAVNHMEIQGINLEPHQTDRQRRAEMLEIIETGLGLMSDSALRDTIDM
ncbi:MAG: hypothetical protein RR859_07275, partial [Ruthenibacterium sp.]